MQDIDNINVDASAIEEAEHFVKTMQEAEVNFYDGKTLPPVLDLEASPYDSKVQVPQQIPAGKCYFHTPEQIQKWVEVFLESVEKAVNVRPIIYTSKSFWQECAGDYTGFSNNTQLWISSWDLDQLNSGNMFGGWTADNYTYWQFTNSGTIKGIVGNVDLDVFNGTSDQLKQKVVKLKRSANEDTLLGENKEDNFAKKNETSEKVLSRSLPVAEPKASPIIDGAENKEFVPVVLGNKDIANKNINESGKIFPLETAAENVENIIPTEQDAQKFANNVGKEEIVNLAKDDIDDTYMLLNNNFENILAKTGVSKMSILLANATLIFFLGVLVVCLVRRRTIS